MQNLQDYNDKLTSMLVKYQTPQSYKSPKSIELKEIKKEENKSSYVIICASHIESLFRITYFENQLQSIINQTIKPVRVIISVSYEKQFEDEVFDFFLLWTIQFYNHNIPIIFIKQNCHMTQFQHINAIIFKKYTNFKFNENTKILIIDDDDVCFTVIGEKLLFNFDLKIDAVYCLDKPYESPREMHGSMVKYKLLTTFCILFQEILNYGQCDVLFVRWIDEHYNTKDVIEFLYKHEVGKSGVKQLWKTQVLN